MHSSAAGPAEWLRWLAAMPAGAGGNRCRWAQITGEGPSPNYPPKSNQVMLKLQQPQSRFRGLGNAHGVPHF